MVLKNQVTGCVSSHLLWSAKESIFKWYSLGKVNFKEHIRLDRSIFYPLEEIWQNYVLSSGKMELVPLSVYYKLFDDLVLTFVYT